MSAAFLLSRSKPACLRSFSHRCVAADILWHVVRWPQSRLWPRRPKFVSMHRFW